jgi:osmotically-inducible protein OsmY
MLRPTFTGGHAMPGSDPTGKPVVLVAEPQALPAMWLEDALADAGYAVAGPYATCEAAVEGLDRSEPAFAVISVDLHEGPCFPLACALRRRGIPFAMFAGSIPVPQAFVDVPVLDRPCLADVVERALSTGRLADGCEAEPRDCPMEDRIRAGEPFALDQCPAACGGQDASPRPGHVDRRRALRGRSPMSDKTLRQSIIDELDFEPSIDAASIGVAVDEGIVTLTGHVGSYVERLAAEKAVRKVRGVRAVVEEIQVRFPSGPVPRDEDIARQAVQLLDWNGLVPPDVIQVGVKDGWVTLTGSVHWQYQRSEAEAGLRRLPGIKGINNLIEISPLVSAEDVRSKIEAALKRNAEVEADRITVTVKDAKVTLDGTVQAWYERKLAERAAWSAPGVRAVEDRLTLA